MEKEQKEKLIAMAYQARANAYAPYSGFQVGAALLTESGQIYTGCNVESASYAPTSCAERTAFCKAISEGERQFRAIAVVGGQKGKKVSGFCPPCGVCRQVMMEFCDPAAFEIVLHDGTQSKVFRLAELLPMGFGPANLEESTS